MSSVNQQRDRLIQLLRDFNAKPAADLREQVLSLIPVWNTLYDLGTNLLPANVRNAARDRLLYYFQKYPNQVISRQELSVVSGISEWARRVRELRVEQGWAIYSGKTLSELPEEERESDWKNLRPDDYVMISTEQDRDAAYRWNLAKQIRNASGGVRSKILEFLRQNVGKAVTGEELRYVAGDKTEWARRVRELRTEEGWPVSTYWNGRPELKSGMYLLEEDRQLPPHDRKIPDAVRREVMGRDSYQCKECGWNRSQWNPDDPRHLEVHHIEHHAEGGSNKEENLLTLCNICHDRRHA